MPGLFEGVPEVRCARVVRGGARDVGRGARVVGRSARGPVYQGCWRGCQRSGVPRLLDGMPNLVSLAPGVDVHGATDGV